MINVQESTGGQTYDVMTRGFGWTANSRIEFELQGGWSDVDGTPVQTGHSAIVDGDGTIDERGIHLYDGYHGFDKWITVNRFMISNVTTGIRLHGKDHTDSADQKLLLQESEIHANAHGVQLYRLHSYGLSHGAGANVQLTAENVDIEAGLGGSGDGVRINGAYIGTSIKGVGANPVTGSPRVCTITSADGEGVHLDSTTWDMGIASFSNVVIYACSSNAIYMKAWRINSGPWYEVRATLAHCTIVDNAGDGVRIETEDASSWANVKDSILANNSEHGLNLGNAVFSNFAAYEDHNVFFNDDIVVNGAVQGLDATSSGANPLLLESGTQPVPWYSISSRTSPAYRGAVDGSHRGAYQDLMIPTPTVIRLR